MLCGRMEFNKVAVPDSNFHHQQQSVEPEKRETEREREYWHKRSHRYVYGRVDRSKKGREEEGTDNLTWRFMEKR
jgi:hypothetical protein